MLKISFVVLAIAFAAQAAVFTPCKWNDADNGVFEVNATDVRVTGCVNQPCVVERGKDYPVEIDFTSLKRRGAFSHDVTGLVNGVELPWPGVFPKGCDTLNKGNSTTGNTCPLAAGSAATAGVLLEIATAWPAISTTATWKLVDDDTAEVILCFTVGVRVL